MSISRRKFKHLSRTSVLPNDTLSSKSLKIDPHDVVLTLYQKASTSNDLTSIFSVVEAIGKYYRKKAVRKRKKMEFQQWMDKMIELLQNFHQSKSKKGWPALFHQHMKDIPNTKQFSYENVQIYLDCFRAFDIKILSQTTQRMVLLLIDFFQYRQMDCLSCLVGLKATKEVVDASQSEFEFEISQTLLSCADNSPLINEDKYSKKDLLQKIIHWSKEENGEKLQREIRDFAIEIRGLKEIKAGAIVLAELSKEKIIFARYSGERKGNLLCLYVNSLENSTVWLIYDQIYLLRGTIAQKIADYEINDIARFIQNDVDNLYQSYMRLCEKEVKKYVQKRRGVDMTAIKKANSNECCISQLKQLIDAKNTLQEMTMKPPDDLILSLSNTINQRTNLYVKELNESDVFLPTYSTSIQLLKSFNVKSVTMMNLNRLFGICESGLDQLQLQKRDLMNGVRKEKTVEWWLNEIDLAVNKFLSNLFSFFSFILFIFYILFFVCYYFIIY